MSGEQSKRLTPPSIAPPFSAYSHGVSIPAGARIVRTSGQLALSAEGDVPDGVEAQAALCFANIEAILAEAGMTKNDVVHLSAFVTRREDMRGYMAARDEWLGRTRAPPASTLVIVSGFTRPEFLVEVEAMAASLD